jgi:hypothetical protein
MSNVDDDDDYDDNEDNNEDDYEDDQENDFFLKMIESEYNTIPHLQ